MIQEAAVWLHGGCYPKAAQLREGLPRSYGEGWCLGTTWHAVEEAGSCLPWSHHFRFWEMAHEAVWSTGFPWRAPLPAAMRIGLCWTCSNGGLCAVPQQAVQGCAACGVKKGTSNMSQGGYCGPLQSVPVDWTLIQGWSVTQEWFDIATLLFSKPERVKLSNEGWVYNTFDQDTFCR